MIKKSEPAELDIVDVESEDSFGQGEKAFSHQALIMTILRKCIEAGSKEMRQGYWNEKVDKFGNVVRHYVSDTRLEFIETVETAQNIMIADYDVVIKENITNILNDLKKKFDDLCLMEQQDWTQAKSDLRKLRWKNGIFYQEGRLNKKLPYYEEYIEDRLIASRKILNEINLMIERVHGNFEELVMIN